MNVYKLQELFPEGRFDRLPQTVEDTFTISCENGFFHIKKKDLTSKELQLLELLAPQAESWVVEGDHSWYRVLFEDEAAPAGLTLRVIQIKLQAHTDFMREEWLEELQGMFLNLVDSFFINDNQLILIEEKSETNYPVEELFGLFQALDIDFDVYTQIFIGTFYEDSATLAKYFLEEQQIFYAVLAKRKSQKEFSFTSSAVNYSIGEAFRNSDLMKTLYQDWFVDPEMTTILTALWKSKGNVSSAAKELFLHRNTVLYRIDKFQEMTRLNLKNMDDLVFCHLLIEIFAEQ